MGCRKSVTPWFLDGSEVAGRIMGVERREERMEGIRNGGTCLKEDGWIELPVFITNYDDGIVLFEFMLACCEKLEMEKGIVQGRLTKTRRHEDTPPDPFVSLSFLHQKPSRASYSHPQLEVINPSVLHRLPCLRFSKWPFKM